jgi:8-oxo-dGTP pyrophosphatase MutT (NUDIX family)
MDSNNNLGNPVFSDLNIWKGTDVRFDIFRPATFDGLINIRQVYGFIFNEQNEVLMVAHDDGIWNLAGGYLEKGETPMDALVRECYEEAAAIVDPEDCISFFVQKAYKKVEGEWVLDELQARYIIKKAKFDKFISDPDRDNPIVQHKFFPVSALKEFLKWGKTTDFVMENLPKYFINHINT